MNTCACVEVICWTKRELLASSFGGDDGKWESQGCNYRLWLVSGLLADVFNYCLLVCGLAYRRNLGT